MHFINNREVLVAGLTPFLLTNKSITDKVSGIMNVIDSVRSSSSPNYYDILGNYANLKESLHKFLLLDNSLEIKINGIIKLIDFNKSSDNEEPKLCTALNDAYYAIYDLIPLPELTDNVKTIIKTIITKFLLPCKKDLNSVLIHMISELESIVNKNDPIIVAQHIIDNINTMLSKFKSIDKKKMLNKIIVTITLEFYKLQERMMNMSDSTSCKEYTSTEHTSIRSGSITDLCLNDITVEEHLTDSTLINANEDLRQPKSEISQHSSNLQFQLVHSKKSTLNIYGLTLTYKMHFVTITKEFIEIGVPVFINNKLIHVKFDSTHDYVDKKMLFYGTYPYMDIYKDKTFFISNDKKCFKYHMVNRNGLPTFIRMSNSPLCKLTKYRDIRNVTDLQFSPVNKIQWTAYTSDLTNLDYFDKKNITIAGIFYENKIKPYYHYISSKLQTFVGSDYILYCINNNRLIPYIDSNDINYKWKSFEE